MGIVSGGGSASATPTLAQVLTKGASAAGTAITALNEIDGDDQPSTSDYSRLTLTAFGSGGGAALTAAAGNPAGAGGPADLVGGGGDTGNTSGAFIRAGGGTAAAHGKLLLRTNNSFGTAGYVLIADGSNVLYGDLGGIKCDTHAAPADGTLAAGDLRVWFDQTNGAAKAMFKGKTANGTVVTASVALA